MEGGVTTMAYVSAFEAYRPIDQKSKQILVDAANAVGKEVAHSLEALSPAIDYVPFSDEHTRHVHLVTEENITDRDFPRFARENSPQDVRTGLMRLFLYGDSQSTVHVPPKGFFISSHGQTAYFGVCFSGNSSGLQADVTKANEFLFDTVRGTPSLTLPGVLLGMFKNARPEIHSDIVKLSNRGLASTLPTHVILQAAEVQVYHGQAA